MSSYQLPLGYLLQQRYALKKCLGQGGFGITYRAFDQRLEQEVCIKELFVAGSSVRSDNMSVLSQDIKGYTFSDFTKRFIQEARQLARFRHANIVRVLDIFQENGTVYMVMDFEPGETLKQKVQREGALSEKEALALMHQLLDAVEEVHNKGMLHRDIKPDNVLVNPEGRVVLIDFGSAREFVEGKTTSHSSFLTPGYAPAEQYSNRKKRGSYTDIYALGATLYFLLTGEKPIASTDRIDEDLTPPHRLNPKVSSQVSSAVMLAMEMKPENRFTGAAEMREALSFLLEYKPVIQEELTVLQDIVGPNEPVFQEGHAEIQDLVGPMVYVEGGTFTMGCTDEHDIECNGDEKPVHQVTLDSFYIGKFPVTQAQWKELMGTNPSNFRNCDSCPVEQVNWTEVQAFIEKLNYKTGKNYRLPTEAEWEYAARGGMKSKGYKYSGSNNIEEVAWFENNSMSRTKKVGQMKENELGLCDMNGNVWEWCNDWYGAYREEKQINPQGPNRGPGRVLRGGSYFNQARNCRITFRSDSKPQLRHAYVGFRLAHSKS